MEERVAGNTWHLVHGGITELVRPPASYSTKRICGRWGPMESRCPLTEDMTVHKDLSILL